MSSFSFAAPRPSRRSSLTPMIDVVFLLLVFFMLAARFGQDTVIAFAPPVFTDETVWQGPPRLVTLTPQTPLLNGSVIEHTGLVNALTPLMDTPEDPILLRAQSGVSLQEMIDLLDVLNSAGLTGAILVD